MVAAGDACCRHLHFFSFLLLFFFCFHQSIDIVFQNASCIDDGVQENNNNTTKKKQGRRSRLIDEGR